jgi:hypothetical protein
MSVYSYFKSAWKDLKGFFTKKPIEAHKSSRHCSKKKPKSTKKVCLLAPIQETKEPLKEFEFNNRALLFVLKKTKIFNLFEKYVKDTRRSCSITYPLASLLMQGMLIHLLRQKSLNAFEDAKKLSPHLTQNTAFLIQAPCAPSPKTVEDAILKINPSDLEPILPHLFCQLLRSKFFKLHPQFKGGVNRGKDQPFKLGIDAQTIHVYHDYNQHPCKACFYCLKRTRDKACWYLHCDVTLLVIGDNGFQFPLFNYRVKANHLWEQTSDKTFKQECELSALPHLLEKFRHYFPKLKADLLLDSLYAQGTTMKLCDKFHLGYITVRKSGSLRSLNSDIEGLKKLQTPLFKESIDGRWNKQQTAYVFSGLCHKGHHFTLID